MSVNLTTTYKGSVNKQFQIDSNSMTSEVRKMLVSDKYIQEDNNEEEWRFFIYNSQSTNFSDAILGKDLESIVPISGMYGNANQLYLTNIKKTKNPDLMGIGTTWFFDRFMSCKVSLNQSDASAKEINKNKFEPMMLTNVRPTSTQVTGIYDNVVVCEKGSSIAFNISSWGAAGFGYSIKPNAGETIVDKLYITFGNNQNKEGSSYLIRYQDKAQQIIIDSTKDMQIPTGKTVEYQRVSVKTWRVTSYKRDGHTYSSNAQPPGSLSRSARNLETTDNIQYNLARADVIPGDTITPGAPHPGDDSDQTFGTISNIKQDDQSNALGEVVIYFFVFKSHEDAIQVIDGINAPNPNVWD